METLPCVHVHVLSSSNACLTFSLSLPLPPSLPLSFFLSLPSSPPFYYVTCFTLAGKDKSYDKGQGSVVQSSQQRPAVSSQVVIQVLKSYVTLT